MKFLRNFLLFLAVICMGLVARADPPVYTGNTFDKLQTATDDASLYFGVVIAACIIVTGFFLGRKWLKSV